LANPFRSNLTYRRACCASTRSRVVGRKNHYGSKSQRGTDVAAIFYSLLESAYVCGVEPKSYIAEATRRAIRAPGAVTLPHEFR